MGKLTDKMERFCQEYLVDLNATQAAIRAGYSENTAGAIGFENLKKPEIESRIQELQKNRSDKFKIDQESIIKDLVTIKVRCMQSEPVMQFDHEKKQMVESGEYRFDSNGALKAIESLAKHIGFYEKDNKQKGSKEVDPSLLNDDELINYMRLQDKMRVK